MKTMFFFSQCLFSCVLDTLLAHRSLDLSFSVSTAQLEKEWCIQLRFNSRALTCIWSSSFAEWRSCLNKVSSHFKRFLLYILREGERAESLLEHRSMVLSFVLFSFGFLMKKQLVHQECIQLCMRSLWSCQVLESSFLLWKNEIN